MHRRLLSRAFRRTRGVGWWWTGAVALEGRRPGRAGPSQKLGLRAGQVSCRPARRGDTAPPSPGASATPSTRTAGGVSRITTVTNLLRHSRQFVRGRQALVRAEARYTTVTRPSSTTRGSASSTWTGAGAHPRDQRPRPQRPAARRRVDGPGRDAGRPRAGRPRSDLSNWWAARCWPPPRPLVSGLATPRRFQELRRRDPCTSARSP